MSLDNQIVALIAVGASVTANCQPCLERNVGTALECGADAAQIADAIEVGKRVRQGAASKMDKFVLHLDYSATPAASAADGKCTCGS